MSDVVMPRLSDTMEEGTILRWSVADGEEVRRGEELVEIETDKANMTYESDVSGTLAIVAAEGETLPVGAVIARVGEPADGGPARGVSDRASGPETSAPDRDEPATEVAQTEQAEALREAESGAPAEPAGVKSAPTEAASVEVSLAGPASAEAAGADANLEAVGGTSAGANGGEGRVKASPLARRIARERGIDLHEIAGSGPGGRIVKADVEGAVVPPGEAPGRPSAMSAETSAAAPARPGGLTDVTRAKGETTEVELTRSQQTVARRMAESKATIPHFALRTDVDMEACVRLRVELKRLAAGRTGGEGAAGHAGGEGAAGHAGGEGAAGEAVPTYNDMVVKACALALREWPRANSSYRDGRLQLHGRVNVGVAVAAESEGPAGGTLVVPTVFDADVKSLGEIARETRALATKVRDGTITPPELGGGTFTVSNLGMFGVDAFTAIVNPPQAAILAVGAVKSRAVVGEDDAIAARKRMTVTLACDHRVLYGADAARFLARIKEALEQPASLTL